MVPEDCKNISSRQAWVSDVQFASDVHVAGCVMLVKVELSLQEVLYFDGRSIESKPSLVRRLRNSVWVDARICKPSTHYLYRVFLGCKELGNLLSTVVLAIVGRVMTRDVHQEVVALVEIGLL